MKPRLSEEPMIMVKYVDDLFAILKRRNIDDVLRKLNEYHPKLKFTLEMEKDGRLPYLDVLLIRNGEEIMTDWYRKPTSSGRLLHYCSYHPKHQRINTVRNFVFRVLSLSHHSLKRKTENIVKEILKENGYPISLIVSLIKQYKNDVNLKEHNSVTDRTNTRIYKSMTYAQGVSDEFDKIIRPLSDRVKMGLRPGKQMSRCFTKLKDKVPKGCLSNVVYEVPCDKSQSCNLKYIGITSQFLKNRIMCHMSDIRNKNQMKTAIASHCTETGHKPDLDKTKILCVESNQSKRLILEALCIQTKENTMNRKTDTANISPIYCGLTRPPNERIEERMWYGRRIKIERFGTAVVCFLVFL